MDIARLTPLAHITHKALGDDVTCHPTIAQIVTLISQRYILTIRLDRFRR